MHNSIVLLFLSNVHCIAILLIFRKCKASQPLHQVLHIIKMYRNNKHQLLFWLSQYYYNVLLNIKGCW